MEYFQSNDRKSVKQDFAKLSSMIVRDLNNNSGQSFTRRYTSDDVSRFLESPTRYAKELGVMSLNLYEASPHYKRLINYYANLPTLDYFITPVGLDKTKEINVEKLKTNYQKAVDLTETMDIKHEFKRMLTTAWIRDAFYGYQHSTKDSYFVQKLPNDYCQISSIEDGVYNLSFDFQYFDRNATQLEFYPKEFKSMYNKYRAGTEGQWIELDGSKTIVLKINEYTTYDIPPFVGIFKSIFDIQDYKNLKKASETISNYKFITQKIPIRDKSERNNDFLIDLNNVAMFHNKTMATLPDEIGLITTPFDVDVVNFAKDKSESDNVQEAEREFYAGAGTSSLLFNQSTSSTKALEKSINVDEQEVFTLIRQVERVINRKLKNEIKGTFKFKVQILDTTSFNKKEVFERLLKSAQYGLPVKMMIGSSLGLTPSTTENMAFLENEVLGLGEMFIPLSSSHTQSGSESVDNEGGRPELDDEELSDEGEGTRDRGDNDSDVR